MRPVIVLSNVKAQCATFFWRERPDFYIGCRFIEHVPKKLPTPLPGISDLPTGALGDRRSPQEVTMSPGDGDPWEKGWMVSYAQDDPSDPIQLRFKTFPDGSAWCSGLDCDGAQQREFAFEPTDDSVAMRMRLTAREPLGGAFAVQQCLRYSGDSNEEWRRSVARVPFLSEYDLQAVGELDESLTYARQCDDWIRLPAMRTRHHTRSGLPFLGERSSDEIDHRLIVRESQDRRWSSGMYWERTAYVSNRHPADCVHALVDFGPLDAGQSRTVLGKSFLIEGTKDELLAVWRRDFPIRSASLGPPRREA